MTENGGAFFFQSRNWDKKKPEQGTKNRIMSKFETHTVDLQIAKYEPRRTRWEKKTAAHARQLLLQRARWRRAKERVQDETSCTSSYSNTSSNESEGIDVNAIKNVRHEIWRLFIECDKTLIQARARKGEAQGVLSYQNQKGISQPPVYIFVLPSDLQFEISKMIVPFHQGTFEDDVPFPKIGWSPGPGYSKMSRKIRAMWVPP